MKTIALFNGRGGAGKTLLAYHLAWMFHHVGLRVVVADLDPQADLTSAFLTDEQYTELYTAQPRQTILSAIEAASRDAHFENPHIEDVEEIGLIPGDVTLAGWEDRFAHAWQACLDPDAAQAADAFRLTTAIERALTNAGEARNADVMLLDLASNLGAINRAALLTADAVIIPLATDIASRLALPTLGQKLTDWRQQWHVRRVGGHASCDSLPFGSMSTIGYVVVQHAAFPRVEDTHYSKQLARIFREAFANDILLADPDASCLAWFRHVRGLLGLQRAARKPMFDLKAADGATGSYAIATKDAYVAFEKLAREVAKRAGIALPERD